MTGAGNAVRSVPGIADNVISPTYTEPYSGEWRHTRCSVCG
jgi:hypothetical protein